MTSITTFHHKEQSNKTTNNDNDSIRDNNDIPLRSRSSSTHCHVPDEKFDYVARNRLIVVFILCMAFMIIEIIGMYM